MVKMVRHQLYVLVIFYTDFQNRRVLQGSIIGIIILSHVYYMVTSTFKPSFYHMGLPRHEQLKEITQKRVQTKRKKPQNLKSPRITTCIFKEVTCRAHQRTPLLVPSSMHPNQVSKITEKRNRIYTTQQQKTSIQLQFD